VMKFRKNSGSKAQSFVESINHLNSLIAQYSHINILNLVVEK
jgi:hypothetical protein